MTTAVSRLHYTIPDPESALYQTGSQSPVSSNYPECVNLMSLDIGDNMASTGEISGQMGEQQGLQHGEPMEAQERQGDQQEQSQSQSQSQGQGQGQEQGQGQGQEQENQKPWTELKTKAGKERKRLPLACIVCRRKKIRCSGEKPSCKHCFRSRIPCVYKVTTRKAAPRTDYMAMLDKRLKRMEERVIKIIPKDEHRDMASIGRAVVKPAVAGQNPRIPRAVLKKRSAEEAFNAELNEWTRSNASTSRPFAQVQPAGENSLLVEGAEHLPSMELQEHLAEVFFDCIYGQSYLLLHKPSFMRKLKAKMVPPVLILAICAVSARFSTHPLLNTEPAFLRGGDWANVAAQIAIKRHDEPNITILTVFLILGLHEFGACHGGRSWSFGGQALRMAYALQLHRELDHDPLGKSSQLSFTDREIRRRTMWACLLMDRYNSSGSQRPPIGNEKFIQIQLPVKESHFQMEIPGPTEDLRGNVPNPVPEGVGQLTNPKDNMGVSAYIIRGIVLWGRIVDYLNLGGKAQDPYPLWAPESGYSQLKRQLEEFSASLPNSLAFTLENLRNHAAEKTANQFLFLHIIIHQNILFLNRFAIPLSPGGRPPKDIPRQFLSDAGRAAVEAAGHISMLINQASGYMLTVPFAGYCAYAASTVHIWGIFSKNAQLEARSKDNLRHAYRYLNKMKRYWGMFHYLVESAKERYRHFADAAMQGSKASQDANDTPMFQYGDWFDKYPHGVSKAHWEDANEVVRDDGRDAVMGQQSDLQSVEEFFASLAPPSGGEAPRKEPKRNDMQRASSSNVAPSPLSQPQPRPQDQRPSAVPDLSLTQSQSQMTSGPSPDFFNSPNIMRSSEDMSFNPSALGYAYTPEPLPQLDRQLVYDAYNGVNHQQPAGPLAEASPSAGGAASDSHTSVPDLPTPNNHPWYMPPEVAAGQNWPGEFIQPNAWFLPFNLDTVGSGFDMPGTSQQPAGSADTPSMNSNLYSAGSPGAMLDGFNLGMGLTGVVGGGGNGQTSSSQHKV
ncbi:hypothetical protein VTO42DRAFT_45 [Malbranchea cinnamomea]